jgi:hypothetical protein
MMAQIVVGHNSQIFQVNLLKGHNNDPGALELTGLKDFLVGEDVKLLADGGVTFNKNSSQ